MKIHLLIYILVATLWSLSLYFYHNPVFAETSIWLKITACLTIVIVLNFFYFVIASKNLLGKFKIPLSAVVVLALAAIFTIFVYDFLGVGDYLKSLGIEAAAFLFLFIVYAGLGAAILLERLLPGSPSTHLQTSYILIIFAIFMIVITVIYVFVPLVTGLKQYLWLAPLSTVVFILFFIFGYRLIKKAGEEFQEKEETEKLAEEWKKLAQAKDQFLLSLQHHLRTPLTPLKIYLEKILDGSYGREENPVIKEKLIEMKKLTETLYSLIESLLDIQELKVGKKILNPEDCQIEDLIKSVIEELKPQAEQKGLYLTLEPTEQKEMIVLKTDEKRTREAAWNIIDNALKYTKKGGVKIRLEVGGEKTQTSRPPSFSGEQWLKIIITDTGIGMTKEEIEDFLKGELFSRGEEAKKLYGPGRGIGLAIALEFIKAQNGRIWADSEGRDKGTTFSVELPIK